LAFLRHIKEHPDDDSLRLIFADWLSEQGDLDRAEFIRLQCCIAQRDASRDDAPLIERMNALRAKHEATWIAPLKVVDLNALGNLRGAIAQLNELSLGYVNWNRGLMSVNLIGIPSRRAAETLAATETWAWVEGLELNHHDWDEVIGVLAKSPLLAGIVTLEADEVLVEDTGMRTLARSPYATSLTRIVFSGGDFNDASVRALTRSPYLLRLTHLDLSRNSITDAGVKALATCPHLSGLRHLDLFCNGITVKGWLALVASPYLTGITRMDARQHNLDESNNLAMWGWRNSLPLRTWRASAG
jgi:uncharacterized protein (TIGR02996 family)